MSRPDTRVRIAFDLAAGGVGDFFTLDDPVKGELDDGPFGLAGDILQDVTDDVRSITVRRGRSRELERYQAGAATVNLDNKDRTYDPSYKVTQSATGGDTTYEIDVSGTTYVVHEFTTVGTATFTPGIVPLQGVEYLVVAGGGAGGVGTGGGDGANGGGGAGGVVASSSPISISGAVSVVVGNGAPTTGTSTPFVRGANGQSSSLGSLVTAIGGGGGGSNGTGTESGSAGGSGGGATGVTGTGGAGTVGQGFRGGNASGTFGGGGGGGGATAIGGDATASTTGRSGGAGLATTLTGTSRSFGGGGGGAGWGAGGGSGGTGGGGGGGGNSSANGVAGSTNTGGGGGAGNNSAGGGSLGTGGAGGSGIVIVRYPKVFFPSPFVASMRPRKGVQITTAGQPVFNGVVDDWDLDYSLNNDHMASVKVTDGFVFLAGQEIEPHTATAQATGARINAILNRAEIAWPPGKRAIDTGSSTLQADAIGGTADPKPVPALPYLQKVDEAEQGALFIGADGSLTFRDRGSLQTLTTDTVFTDDGTGIPFTNINAAYGAEELRNRVTVSRLNGGTATAVDAASVLAYGAIDFEIRDSLLADDAQAQSLADAIVARYAEPLLRIDDIEVVLNALTPVQVAQVLALELGALVRVLYTPSGIGDAIDQFVRLDQIEHNIDATQHRVRLSFSQGEPPALVLDSATFGLLDVNTLAF
jgi:hypothetical protein